MRLPFWDLIFEASIPISVLSHSFHILNPSPYSLLHVLHGILVPRLVPFHQWCNECGVTGRHSRRQLGGLGRNHRNGMENKQLPWSNHASSNQMSSLLLCVADAPGSQPCCYTSASHKNVTSTSPPLCSLSLRLVIPVYVMLYTSSAAMPRFAPHTI